VAHFPHFLLLIKIFLHNWREGAEDGLRNGVRLFPNHEKLQVTDRLPHASFVYNACKLQLIEPYPNPLGGLRGEMIALVSNEDLIANGSINLADSCDKRDWRAVTCTSVDQGFRLQKKHQPILIELVLLTNDFAMI
jgi:hypothetical protein